jgi:hypothetical protein
VAARASLPQARPPFLSISATSINDSILRSILEILSHEDHDVVKPLIDDRELSEIDRISLTDLQQNYIEWLIHHAGNDHGNTGTRRIHRQ